jgi:hypothetical protein
MGPKEPFKKGNVTHLAASDATRLFATTDGGQVWMWSRIGTFDAVWKLMSEHPDPDAIPMSLAIAPSNPDVVFVAYQGASPGNRVQRLRATPDGEWVSEFIAVTLPVLEVPDNVRVAPSAVAVHPTDERIVFLGTSRGVYQGTSYGNTWLWVPYDNGLPRAKITALVSIPLTGEIRAATDSRGVWTITPYPYPSPGPG